jgi:hypothetical protein
MYNILSIGRASVFVMMPCSTLKPNHALPTQNEPLQISSCMHACVCVCVCVCVCDNTKFIKIQIIVDVVIVCSLVSSYPTTQAPSCVSVTQKNHQLTGNHKLMLLSYFLSKIQIIRDKCVCVCVSHAQIPSYTNHS